MCQLPFANNVAAGCSLQNVQAVADVLMAAYADCTALVLASSCAEAVSTYGRGKRTE